MRIRQTDSAVEAYHSGHGRMERRVLDYLRFCGSRGATILEIATALVVASNCVTGRLHDLAATGLVYTLERKRRCDINPKFRKLVWVAIERSIQLTLI